MTNLIMDTGNIAELNDLGPDDEIASLDATKEATDAPMEFHVQMKGHTFRDMEDLIVNAAAQQLVGRYGGTDALRKQIEAKTIEHVTKRADAVLATVSAEIIDQPMMPKYVGAKEEPVTMREFIGLTGRAYLAERVDESGKAASSSSGYGYRSRMEFLVDQMMSTKFKNEIAAATNAAISEIQKAVKAQHDALIAEEKKRLADALAKLSS